MACCVVVALGTLATPAFAQQEPTAPPPLGFLTKYDLDVEAAAIAGGDSAFRWDARLGAVLDVVDYGSGRVRALADYHGVFGEEFQPFDPNQAYFTFEVSGSYRFERSELAGRLHHVSRHLGDRPKGFGIDWNTLGVALEHRLDRERLDLSVRGSFDQVYKSNFVDYESIIAGGLESRYPDDRRVSFVSGGNIELYLTDDAIGGRSHVTGALVHAGMRLEGRAAAVELFAAFERRIDVSPFTRGTEQWALFGFRVLNR
jgi:hypothetical protein